jgi:hypothetical protein
MLAQKRFGRAAAHAVRRSARAGADVKLFGYNAQTPDKKGRARHTALSLLNRCTPRSGGIAASEHGYALPTARSFLPPSNPRSGGIRPSRMNSQPHPFPRPTLSPPRTRGLGRLAGDRGGLRRGLGNRQGSPAGSPLGSARTVQSSRATLCATRKRPNRQGSPAGSLDRLGSRSDLRRTA